MGVTREEVEKIAKLAKLQFLEEEIEQFRKEFNQILTYVEKLNKLDTSGVEPTSDVQGGGETMREDRVVPSLPQEEVLKNAPKQVRGFFSVPKIIPGE